MARFSKPIHSNGFTFLEMALSLTIIALIVGAILVGKDLIRSSELLAVPADIKKFSTGINAFRDKYNALPGDFARAADIWGQSPDGCTAGILQTTTCNGNGNGKFFYCGGFCGVTPGNPSNPTEYFTFWQHLSDAGFIDGLYTGAADWKPACGGPPCPPDSGPTLLYHPGKNVPRSKLTGGGYTMGVSNGYFVLGFGGFLADGTAGYILTPAEAKNIDIKIDDGLPNTGLVTGVGTNCGVSAGDPPLPVNEYNSSYNDIACTLSFTLTGV